MPGTPSWPLGWAMHWSLAVLGARISPGGGEEGWLHPELCWASQSLPAVIVQLLHSAFLMGKHRW